MPVIVRRRHLLHRLLGAHRGMTLLEIMIVLAIMALVMGLVVGPAIMGHYRKARHDLAAMAVTKLVNEAYPAWAMSHPGKTCPEQLVELTVYATSKDTEDPWGNRYKMYCGPGAPPEAHGFGVSSAGEDGTHGTDDDLRSW